MMTTLEPTSKSDDPKSKPFHDLSELRKKHDALEEAPDDVSAEEKIDWKPHERVVRDFIARACATGRELDDDSDRFSAQRLITYWVNYLVREKLPVPTRALLEAYNEDVHLDESARPYTTPAESVRTTSDLAGWTRLIQECLDRLMCNGLAAIIGPSGSGRRTLVTAGVLPWLRDQIAFNDRIRRQIFAPTPGPKPLTELVRALAPEADLAVTVPSVRANPAYLATLLYETTVGPAVVVIDRLEALFKTLDREDIEPYLKTLLALRDGGQYKVLVTLRSDGLAQLGGFEGVADAFKAGQVPLVFTTRELRQAIEEPARRAGLRFDPGVVDRLLTDVQGDPAVIPLLQFSLIHLWKNREGNRVTRKAYQQLGGGRAALLRVADQVNFELSGTPLEEVLQKIMPAMVRRDLGRELVGQTVTAGDLRRLGDAQQVDEILRRLVAAHLVEYTPAAESVPELSLSDDSAPTAFADNDKFSLIHVALVEAWPTFQEWLEADRDVRRKLQVLQVAAEKWRDSNRSDSLLWGGPALDEAETYTLSDPLQTEFLTASRRRERAIKKREDDLVRARKFRSKLRVAAALVILGLLCLLFYMNSRLARSEADHEQKLRKERDHQVQKLGVQAAIMSVDAGLTRDGIAGPSETNDPAGAVLWYAEALNLFNEHAVPKPDQEQALTAAERDLLEDNLRFRLATSSARLPVLRSLISWPNVLGTMFRTDRDGKSDSRWAASWTNPDQDGQVRIIVRDLESVATLDKLAFPGNVDAVAFRLAVGGDVLLSAGSAAQGTGGAEAIVLVRVWARAGATGPWPAPHDVPLGIPGRVIAAELSPDGRRAAIVVEKRAGKDRSHRIFRLSSDSHGVEADWSANELTLPKDTVMVVNRIAFQPPGGGVLAAALQDQSGSQGRIGLWGPGKKFTELQHFDRAAIRYLAFSPNGDWMATCSGAEGGVNGTVQFWGRQQRTTEPVAPNDERVEDKPLEPVNGVFTPHDSAVLHAVFNGSSDRPSDRVITCGENGKAVLTSLPGPLSTSVPESIVLTHGSRLFAADFSPDDRFVVTGSRDQKARVWEVATGTLAIPPLNHSGSVSWVGYDRDGRTLCTRSGGTTTDGKEVQVFQVWELAESDTTWFVPTPGPVRFVSSRALDGPFVTVAIDQAYTETRVWTADASPLSAPRGRGLPMPGNGDVNFAAMTPKGDRVVTLSGRAAQLWDDTGKIVVRPRLPEHLGVVNYACFDHSGKLLVTAAGDKGDKNGEVRFWDARTGARIANPGMTADSAFLFAAVSPDGKWIVATGGPGLSAPVPSANNEVWAVLWPLDENGTPGQPLKLRGHHTEPVTFAAFSADCRYIVTAAKDNRAVVWSISTSAEVERVAALTRHTADVVQAVFNPTGQFVATAGEDGKAIIWETTTGREVMTLDHGSRVSACAFDNSAGFLATAGQDGKVRLWQVQDLAGAVKHTQPPAALVAAFSHRGPVDTIAFVGDRADLRLRTVARLALASVGSGPDDDVAPSAMGMDPNVSFGPAQSGFWVTEWVVRPDRRAPDAIRAETQIVARRTLNRANRELRLLTVEELNDAWATRDRIDRSNQPDEKARLSNIMYSDRAARQAASVGLSPTAIWHLDRAIRLAKEVWDDKARLPAYVLPELYARRAAERSGKTMSDDEVGLSDPFASRTEQHFDPHEAAKLEAIIKDYDEAIIAANPNRIPDTVRATLYANAAIARLMAALIQQSPHARNVSKGVPDQRTDENKDSPTAKALADRDCLVAEAEQNYDQAKKLGLRDIRMEAQLGDCYRSLADQIDFGGAKAAFADDAIRLRKQAVDHYTRAIELRATLEVPNPFLFVQRSVMNERLANWDAVVEDLSAVLREPQKKANIANLYRHRADARQRQNQPDYKSAIADYIEAIRLYSQQPRHFIAIPEDFLKGAVELAEKHDPDQIPQVLLRAGILQNRLGKWDDATKSLKRASEYPVLSRDWELWKELARAYATMMPANLDDAAAAYASAIRAAEADDTKVLKSQVAELWQSLASVFTRGKKWDQANRAHDQAVALATTDDEAVRSLLVKGRSITQSAYASAEPDRWTKAIEAFSRALDRNPAEPVRTTVQQERRRTIQERARAYERRGQFTEAAADYGLLIAEPPARTDLLMDRARAWAGAGMWAEARKDLIAYTTKLPNDRRAWEYLAIANLQLGDDAGYRTTCERTVAQFGRMNTAADRNAVARVLALADVPGRNWDAEMERMDIPIRQSPKYQPYLNTRGVLLFRASKYEDALNQLDESRKAYTGSLGLPPGGNKVDGSATDQLFLAMTYYKSNQPDKAAEWLKKATTWLDAVKALKPNPVTVWQIAEWEYHRDEAIKMIKFKD